MTAPARECQPEATPLRQHAPAPWELIEATEHHGAYIVNSWGRTICDLYAMSNPMSASVRNGGNSYPVHFDDMEANAAFIVEAVNSHATLQARVEELTKALETIKRTTFSGSEMEESYQRGNRDAHVVCAALAASAFSLEDRK